jgi:large-conductance mechanosensitive channel
MIKDRASKDKSLGFILQGKGIHIGQQHLVSTVGSLLSSPSSFLFLRMFIFILFYFSEETRRKKINKRYEEVDGVRKEKERLTNDHRSLIFTFHLLSSTILFPGFFLVF